MATRIIAGSILCSPIILLAGGAIYTAINPSCEDGGPCSQDETDSINLQEELGHDFSDVNQFTLNSQTHRFGFSGYYQDQTNLETCLGAYQPSSANSPTSIIGSLACDGSG